MEQKEAIKSIGSMGGRLRELRKRLHKTQEDMGRLLGLRKSTYGKYERRENFPTVRMLHTLAKEFNVSSDYLLCGRGSLFYGEEKEKPRDEENEELKELIYLMKTVPFVYFSVMGHFQLFKAEKQDIIHRELARLSKSPVDVES